MQPPGPRLAQGTSEPAALDQLEEAEKHMQQAEKEYDAALEVCEEAIKRHPDLEPRARLLMSRIYREKGRWHDAAVEAKKVVKKFPDSREAVDALKLIYRAHISAGHPQGTEAWILPLIEYDLIPARRGPEALERLCNIYSDMNGLEKVLATATRLIETYPDSPEVKRAVSYIRSVYQRRGGTEAGLLRLREIIGRHSGTYLASCAQYEIGRVYVEKKDRPEAIKEHQNFMREYPDSPLYPIVQREIGELYFHEGNFGSAIAEFSKALKLYPEDPKYRARVLRALAVSYVKNGEYDEAIEQYQAILQMEHRFVGSYAAASQHAIGNIYYFYQRDYEEASKAYQKIVDDYPNSSWVPLAQKKIDIVRQRIEKAQKK